MLRCLNELLKDYQFGLGLLVMVGLAAGFAGAAGGITASAIELLGLGEITTIRVVLLAAFWAPMTMAGIAGPLADYIATKAPTFAERRAAKIARVVERERRKSQ